MSTSMPILARSSDSYKYISDERSRKKLGSQFRSIYTVCLSMDHIGISKLPKGKSVTLCINILLRAILSASQFLFRVPHFNYI